jgi:hypothetical protein
MDDCAPIGGKREITARRRRRRRGERGCTTMISFFHVFLGEICQRILLLCISSLVLDIFASQIYFCMCTFATLFVCHGLLFLEWDLEMHMCHHHITIITC